MTSFWNRLFVPETSKRFEPVLRTLSIPFPPNTHVATDRDVGRLTAFLERHFGSDSVVLKPVLKPSLNEIILFVTEGNDIVATIRYKASAFFEGQPIHLIDCFCMHPSKRRTGLATQLLGALHAYTNDRGLRYSLFLKEGNPLATAPFYSSSYAYRRSAMLGDLKPLSPLKASRLVHHYCSVRPDTVWIHDVANPNQHWRFWKEGRSWMLACFQDAFQEWHKERIGWMTAFFASGSYDLNRIVDAAPFPWIWMDAEWLECCLVVAEQQPSAEQWKADGAFHWYAYQWTSSLRPNGFYGIVV